MEVSVQLAA